MSEVAEGVPVVLAPDIEMNQHLPKERSSNYNEIKPMMVPGDPPVFGQPYQGQAQPMQGESNGGPGDAKQRQSDLKRMKNSKGESVNDVWCGICQIPTRTVVTRKTSQQQLILCLFMCFFFPPYCCFAFCCGENGP